MMNTFASVVPAQAGTQMPVILAHAGIQKVLPFTRRPREGGDPEVCGGLDSRLRGNDEGWALRRFFPSPVILANAGIQGFIGDWIPAFAGMTTVGGYE